MPSAAPSTSHIVIDDQGRACVAETSFRVDQLAVEHVAYGWTAEEIYVQHYRRLTPAQIHAALAFYHDHQAEFDEQMKRDDEAFERLRSDAGPTPFAVRMRRQGRIPGAFNS